MDSRQVKRFEIALAYLQLVSRAGRNICFVSPPVKGALDTIL